jgi:hypothetical protein
VAVILLLPLFFVFTGLKTEIGLINDPYLWKVTGAIIWLPLWVSSLEVHWPQICWTELERQSDYCLDEHKGLMELIV